MDPDSPKLMQLIVALASLGDPAVADQLARKIHPIMLDLLVSYRSRGHDIGRDVGDFYARARTTTVGLARELRDLRRAARKAVAGKLDKLGWIRAWAALPDRTQRRLWRPQWIQTVNGWTIDPATLAGSYSAPGFAMVAPKAAVVLPAIEAALKTTPGPKRRRANEEEPGGDCGNPQRLPGAHRPERRTDRSRRTTRWPLR